jgi:hypothetical protein
LLRAHDTRRLACRHCCKKVQIERRDGAVMGSCNESLTNGAHLESRPS